MVGEWLRETATTATAARRRRVRQGLDCDWGKAYWGMYSVRVVSPLRSGVHLSTPHSTFTSTPRSRQSTAMMTRSSCRRPSNHLPPPPLLLPLRCSCFDTTTTTPSPSHPSSTQKNFSSILFPSSRRPPSVIFEGLLFFSAPSPSSRGIQHNINNHPKRSQNTAATLELFCKQSNNRILP